MDANQIAEEGYVKDGQNTNNDWISQAFTIIALSLILHHIFAAGYKPLPAGFLNI